MVTAVTGWFAKVDLDSASPAGQRLFIEICRLLDRLQPSLLSPERQTATVKNGETLIRLVHAVDRHADLDLVVGQHTAHVYGLGAHEEV